jgi:hypothetical protein
MVLIFKKKKNFQAFFCLFVWFYLKILKNNLKLIILIFKIKIIRLFLLRVIKKKKTEKKPEEKEKLQKSSEKVVFK